MTRPPSILSSFQALRETAPERRLFTWVDEHGRDAETLTVKQLADAADAIATSLAGWGLVPGDRAMLVYPPGLDFVKAFLGCLAAGVVPVPAYPPDPFRLERDLAAFGRIVESAGARLALTNGAYERSKVAGSVAGLFGRETRRWPRIPWQRTDRRLRGSAGPAWHEAGADDLAFLQFTSGSTGDPKGVMVTHANLAHEIAANVVDLRLHEGTRGVFWLPQYHDMGLVNVILSTVAGNSSTHLLSPLTFLRRPAVWLSVMSRVGATVTSAPNFAYELAVRKTTPAQRKAWDLSTVEMAICAAEPVRDSTVTAFLDAFAVTGLRSDAFFTAYGLAENTASVTNRGAGRLRLDTEALARDQVVVTGEGGAVHHGCGRAGKPGDRVRIVDPDTRVECPPDRVGEIWVRSVTTAAGYWDAPEETATTFHATIAGGDGTEYLRTGDLGFLHDGELYVTGRRKDLMIIRGRNVHPSDVEDSVRDCHPLVRPGGVLAFSTGLDGPGDGERVVVLVETRADRLGEGTAEEICAAVRRAVYAGHQLACGTVVLGRPGLVRKTTSGKPRRRVCRQAFLAGELAGVRHVWTSSLAGSNR